MDVPLLIFLILLNGLFAMSEMGLTASRKARLQVMIESGETFGHEDTPGDYREIDTLEDLALAERLWRG